MSISAKKILKKMRQRSLWTKV